MLLPYYTRDASGRLVIGRAMVYRGYMEFERTDPVPNDIFTFNQSDGSVAKLDFSASGELGDFAFYRQRPESDRPEYFYSYHTNTGDIFKYFLGVVMSQPDAGDHIARVNHRIREFEQDGMIPTDQAPSDFTESDLSAILESAAQGQRPAEYSGGDLSLVSNDIYTTCSLPEHGRAVEIPHDQAWQFIAGMIWRSYIDPSIDRYASSSSRSRHSSASFKKAIATATMSLQGRCG